MCPCMRATLTPHVCTLYDSNTQTLTRLVGGLGLVLVLVLVLVIVLGLGLEVAPDQLHRTQPIGVLFFWKAYFSIKQPYVCTYTCVRVCEYMHICMDIDMYDRV